jgi:hypothetical protein
MLKNKVFKYLIFVILIFRIRIKLFLYTTFLGGGRKVLLHPTGEKLETRDGEYVCFPGTRHEVRKN